MVDEQGKQIEEEEEAAGEEEDPMSLMNDQTSFNYPLNISVNFCQAWA